MGDPDHLASPKVKLAGDQIAEMLAKPGSVIHPLLSDAAPGYEPLAAILDEAYEQAAHGKGKLRHARGQPFVDQPIMTIGRMVGVGYQTGQSMKKTQEACGMLTRGEPTRARAELLGAINYLAAAIMLIDEQNPSKEGTEA